MTAEEKVIHLRALVDRLLAVYVLPRTGAIPKWVTEALALVERSAAPRESGPGGHLA